MSSKSNAVALDKQWLLPGKEHSPMDYPLLTGLVPIKGASERVKGKNLRDFCGKPLLCHVLRTLEDTQRIQRIVVNTDSDAVAALALQFSKVAIHRRPEELRGHQVPMNHVLAHDLKLLGEGHYLQTHATNPMLTSATVEHAAKTYFDALGEYDSLFSVVAHHSRFFTEDRQAFNHDPSVLLNTQDLPPLYEENSCLYIFSAAAFWRNRANRIGKKYQLYPMEKMESLDIDTESDFKLAEAAWRAFRKTPL